MKDEIINQQIQVQKQQVSKIFKTTSQVFGNMGFSFLNLQLIMEGFWQILLYVWLINHFRVYFPCTRLSI